MLNMDKYEVIGWPEIQEYMDKEGFEENSTLILPNLHINIDSSTYLVNIDWLKLLLVSSFLETINLGDLWQCVPTSVTHCDFFGFLQPERKQRNRSNSFLKTGEIEV